MTDTKNDLIAADVKWDLEPLLDGSPTPDALIDKAKSLAESVSRFKGKVASASVDELVELMSEMAEINELIGRAGNYAMLRFSENMASPENGSLRQKVEELATEVASMLIFVELEFAAADDAHAEKLLSDPKLKFCKHYLEQVRKNRPYLLSEEQEHVLMETSVAGASSWVRLFSELTSAIQVNITDDDGQENRVSLELALSRLQHPDSVARRSAADAITEGLGETLKTRAFVYNTLLLDKSIDDRLRSYDTWISSRNLSNEASDESVNALIDAVAKRYDIPQRWYRLKAKILGLDVLTDSDRMAPLGEGEQEIGWKEGTEIVRDAYESFSPELASIVNRFISEGWIDAPISEGKQPGAFCAYTVPSHHPYVLLNWTSRPRDVLTLAHELGHGLHAYLSRDQGIFHQTTPLTLAETASVFGETVTNNRLISLIEDPKEKLALLASVVDDSIATVFRQVAMNRFEHSAHLERREAGELSVDRFGELWINSQRDMMGDSVELSDGYASWWSYVPHFIGSPGYVYAYAYGQLLALSVYAQYEKQGDDFVPLYIEMLKVGGSTSPEELGSIVNCDLADPSFWSSGLDIVETQLTRAEEASKLI